MAVSDLIITKPGGLTVSEVLSMELAPIFIFTVPGQEARNAAILKKYGIGVSPRSLKEVGMVTLYYRDHPQDLEKVRENIRRIKKIDTLGEICACCMRR
jgi:processive 1,2-diacylglycerol beta-glucosyltransferase